jgi:hypothetical protein
MISLMKRNKFYLILYKKYSIIIYISIDILISNVDGEYIGITIVLDIL